MRSRLAVALEGYKSPHQNVVFWAAYQITKCDSVLGVKVGG